MERRVFKKRKISLQELSRAKTFGHRHLKKKKTEEFRKWYVKRRYNQLKKRDGSLHVKEESREEVKEDREGEGEGEAESEAEAEAEGEEKEPNLREGYEDENEEQRTTHRMPNKRTGKKRMNAFAKAQMEFLEKKKKQEEERKRKAEEREKREEERKKRAVERKAERKQHFKRNRKGQPILGGVLNGMLKKLEKDA
eukprot:TRINITY_DN677_c0_g1_i4.p1 TRINITY_DN677_c0_g1~~TRINITY_DN677_c0_g1_i4.p1  ORF type:complete len:196 (-),score=91.47 TRINITY_DN677_c0_g1_i4:1062-1649(-)